MLFAQPPARDTQQERYEWLFRALEPTVVVEITEAKLNQVIREHPEQLEIPESYEDPQVELSPGTVEVGARTRFLFIVSRVRVRMVPKIRDGRLRLVVSRVHAGKIQMPATLYRGVAEMIEKPINQWLEQSNVRLAKIEITDRVVRATARVRPIGTPTRSGIAVAPAGG
ncbi:MAG: hypothetical protein R6V19_13095 [Armatimonadota bacterium]